MKIKIKLTILFLTLIFNACSATKIKNFAAYQPQILPRSSQLPSPEILANNRAYKVVVFKLEDNDNSVAKNAGLGESIAVMVENVLTKNRLAELVDRAAATKLEKEIALAEMSKTGSYKGPQIADYAVSGSISNASFTKKYSAGSVFFDPRSKTFVKIPPRYTYESSVSGNLKIYELPSMAVAELIDFESSKSRSENVQSDGGVSMLGLVEVGGTKNKGVERDDELARNAAGAAINNIAYKIKNFFARTAYIMEKRSLKSKSIFKISLGSSAGLKRGDEFTVIGKYEVENQLTGKIEIERRNIATGRVTDQINPESAWVIIDDKETVNNIRLGDMVKFKYDRGFFSKVFPSD